MVRYVRRWRMTTDGNDALALAPGLPDADVKRLRRLIDECLDGRGGEATARGKARIIGATVATLDSTGRRRFFELLATEYGEDPQEVDGAIDAVIRAAAPAARRTAEGELRTALEPKWERLLRRFAGLDGGLPFLVSLREDLRSSLSAHPELAPVDADLKRILDSWFDVALLRLERLTWDSSATLLERLIDYEAVHAIESWDDLKGRLGPGRRCYAFLHPAMPDDPLIFVEVALTEGIASSLPAVLDHAAAADLDADIVDTAIFYSISNCHDGLAGVRLGDFLIKSVAEQLSHELPNIKRFATLSPLPGFRRWLERSIDEGELTIGDREAEMLAPGKPAMAQSVLAGLVTGPVPDPADPLLAGAQPILLRLAADYVLNQRRGNRALDPVAHFHLSNGALVERLNWWANPSAAGWERGLGMMVNYGYRLKNIEKNHDAYVGNGEVTSTDAVRKLLAAVAGSRKTE